MQLSAAYCKRSV